MTKIFSMMAVFLALFTISESKAKDLVILLDESYSSYYMVAENGVIIRQTGKTIRSMPLSREIMAGVMFEVLKEFESLKYVVLMPWSDKVAEPTRLKDGLDLVSQWQKSYANTEFGSATNIGNTMRELANGPDCQALMVMTDGFPSDKKDENLPEIFADVLARQPISIFIMDSVKAHRAVTWYRSLSQSPNYRVMILKKENVLGVIPQMLEETVECAIF